MSEHIQQPARAVLERQEQINNIIVEIFKKTGTRISKDDPVLSLLFIHEEIQKKQSALIKEDFILLTEAFRSVLSSMEQENIQRFKNIVETCGDLDQEIKDAVGHAKNDLNETATSTKEKLTNDLIELISVFKKNQDDTHNTHTKNLKELTSIYKDNLASVKPFSRTAAIVICAACTIFVTAGLSGAFWYVAQQQKESSLRFYANGYTDMRTLTEKTISKLPKTQQEQAKAELSQLENRQPD